MAILLEPPPLTRRTTPASAALWLTLYIMLVIAGGALLGGWLIQGALVQGEGWLYDLVAENGADRVLRRFQTLLAILLAPVLLKKIGWNGFGDMGWSSRQTRGERKRDFVVWFLVGLVAMSGLFAVAFAVGVRDWLPFSFTRWAGRFITAFLVTGIGVSFFEETLTRGVLYRSMARVWSSWAGAVVSSAIFAWGHFMKASDASFQEGPVAVLWSSLFDEFSVGPTPLKCLNMFLFGLVLCRLVKARGDIWAAVGLHAAAVGTFKWFSRQTQFVPEVGYQPWLGGHSSKFDDGWAMAVVLTVMMLWIEWRGSHSNGRTRLEL